MMFSLQRMKEWEERGSSQEEGSPQGQDRETDGAGGTLLHLIPLVPGSQPHPLSRWQVELPQFREPLGLSRRARGVNQRCPQTCPRHPE